MNQGIGLSIRILQRDRPRWAFQQSPNAYHVYWCCHLNHRQDVNRSEDLRDETLRVQLLLADDIRWQVHRSSHYHRPSDSHSKERRRREKRGSIRWFQQHSVDTYSEVSCCWFNKTILKWGKIRCWKTTNKHGKKIYLCNECIITCVELA